VATIHSGVFETMTHVGGFGQRSFGPAVTTAAMTTEFEGNASGGRVRKVLTSVREVEFRHDLKHARACRRLV